MDVLLWTFALSASHFQLVEIGESRKGALGRNSWSVCFPLLTFTITAAAGVCCEGRSEWLGKG